MAATKDSIEMMREDRDRQQRAPAPRERARGLQDDVPVEIWHLASFQQSGDFYTTKQSMSYSKYPFVVEGRPEQGRRVVEHNCEHCGTRMKFTLYSAALLKKLMLIFGIPGIVLTGSMLGLAAAFGRPGGIGAMGIALVVLGALGALLLMLVGYLLRFWFRRLGVSFSPDPQRMLKGVHGRGIANVQEHMARLMPKIVVGSDGLPEERDGDRFLDGW